MGLINTRFVNPQPTLPTMAFQLLALVCLAGAALAGPFQRDVGSQCATSCPASTDNKFDYRPGSQYNYRYKGIDILSAAGNRKQQKTELTADVEINVLDRCEMTLQLKNIQYRGEHQLSRELEEQLAVPLHFSWVDGNIENICSSSDESQESENIKRGILSAIVNTMPDLRSPSQQRELDSLGSCETKYTIIRNAAGSVTIKKEKSLKSCDNRHSGLSSFPYNPYQSPESKIQALPIFTNEKSECQQVIQDQVMQQVVCKASAQLQPLSRYDSLVEFQGEIQLELQNVQRSSTQKQRLTSSQIEKKSIRYSYDQERDVQSREQEANDILTELCPKTQGLLHPTVSKLFVRLVMALKGLPAENVQRIHESLKSQRLCNSPKTLDIFLDALPMAGTEGSIKLMVELLQTKQVPSLKAKIWPASFALIPNPNAEAISAVLPLVSGEEKSRPVLLGLSAMINKVCSNRNCDQVESVRNAVSSLQQGLGSQCSADNENEIISILKAFGNMGYHGQAEETILACAQSQDKSVNVRLAAIDAFRRYSKKIPSSIIEIYSSPNENFELRIAALATVVKNDDERIAEAIQRVLSNDQDEQVVAYTASLVKNLQKTSSPLKQNMKEALRNIQAKRDVGYWENSKNIEISAFNVPTNVGASLESNIIHAQGTKVPRAVSSKIDVDIFGKNVNVFEFGVRAEGLEKAAKKILGLDDSNKQKKSWFTLARSSEEEDKSEMSFYLRTMGTEFLDMTISDFTSVGNMMQFADVVNKLSQGEKADFAHSFLFLNTKIIIPSVTGRSYAFGMTGSATVGLSANGKFDIVNLMSSPRNCDVGGRIQPSANVEITTTLGIHSEKSRPDIKIVTLFHSEADVGAKLKVKDSHMVEARLDMPSEKVQLLKVSTELFEVDANENETPIIEDMQQKINHCIRTLEKPLGIQLCGKLETPRPFVSKNFPYARGIGNFELSIRKTDSSMQGYSVSLELPKHKSDRMLYKFILDTPGSSIRRKFHATLDLKKTASDECEFKLNAQSPFKDIETSGSYTWRSNYAQGSLNVIADKSRRYSVKTVMEMSRSSSEVILKPTLQWTLPESEPVSVSGSIVYNNRRKQQITVDLRSNKSGMKPYVLTGTLMKDGEMGLTKRHQWRMSADLVAKTPLFSTKIHHTAEKMASQSPQGISSSLSIDYETQRSRKQSIKLSSKIQQSSDKLSASAQLETTQNPKLNWALNWDVQGNPKQIMKNDIMLKYGRNPEQTYIQISQNSQIGDKNSPAEGKIAIKAPQFSIDSELKLALGLNVQNSGNFHLESDLRYKENRHIQCSVQLKQLSKKPIKMALKAQLEYPGRKLVYKDEIEETSPNTFQGRSILQWQPNQQASLQYKYKKLSDASTFHHEFESTLNAPFMRSQMTNQASVKLSKESMEIQAHIQGNRQSEYKISAQLRRKGQSQLQISSPIADADVEVNNKEEQKSGRALLLWKKQNPHQLSASASLNLGSRKSLQAEASWDADRNPSQKVSIVAEYETTSQRSKKSFNAKYQLQLLDLITASVSSSGEKGPLNTLQSTIDVSGRKFERVVLNVQSKLSSESIQSIIRVQQGQREKAVAKLDGNLAKRSDRIEIQASASLKSPDRSFEDKELFVQQSYSSTRSATNLQCTMRFENAPGKKHELVAEFSNEARLSKKLRIAVETPYQRFQQQEINLSQRKEQDKYTINAAVQYSKKEVVLSAVSSKTNQGKSIEISLRTPLQAVREVSVLAAYKNQRSEKSIESHLELNGQRKFEASGIYTSRHGQQSAKANAMLQLKSELKVEAMAEKSKDLLSHELSLEKDSSRLLSYKVSHRISGEEFVCQIEAQSKRDTVLDVKLTKEVREQIKYTLKVNKPVEPISVVIQTSKNEQNSRILMVSTCKESGERRCLNVKGYYKQEANTGKYSTYRKITFDVEKQHGSRNTERLCNIHFLHSKQERTLRSKLQLEIQEKKYGYDVSMKQRSDEESPCVLESSLILPSRTLRCTFSAIHNARRSDYEFVAIPNTSSPNSKVTLEIKRDTNARNNEIVGEVKLNHPAINKPVSMKYTISKEQSQLPKSGRIELEYSQNQRDNIILEFSNQNSRSQPEKKALQLQVFTQSKELDLTLKASIHQASRQDIISGEWSWQSKQGKRSGSLNIQLSDKKSGRPENIQIQYTCPNSQLSLEGQAKWESEKLPSQLQLRLLSQSRKIGQIQYSCAESCAEIEIQSSSPLLKNRVCINKKQQNIVTVLSIETTCQDNECLKAQIDLDPSQSHIANIAAKWQKEQFQQLLKTVKRQLPSLEQLRYKEAKQEVAHKVQTVYNPLKQQVLKPILTHMTEQARQLVREQEEELQQVKRQIKELAQKLPKMPTLKEVKQQIERVIEFLREDIIQYLEENAPEWLANLAKSALREIERYLREVCRRGTLCYQVKQTYQRRGIQQVQRLLKAEFNQKIEKLQRSQSQKLNQARNYVKKMWEKLASWVDEWKEKVSSMMPSWRQSELARRIIRSAEEAKEQVKQRSKRYIEKLMELVDKLLDHARRNEDFKVLSSLLEEAKTELEKASRAIDLKQKLESLKEEIMHKVSKGWLQEKVNVSDFDVESGTVQVRLHHPFDQSKMQLLKNVLVMVKNKCRSFQQ